MPSFEDRAWDDEAGQLDDDGADRAALHTEAEILCPHCGEAVTIALDPAGGLTQDYVEDCAVCCRPWRLRVTYDSAGAPFVEVQALE